MNSTVVPLHGWADDGGKCSTSMEGDDDDDLAVTIAPPESQSHGKKKN